jgi:hypothetical protein
MEARILISKYCWGDIAEPLLKGTAGRDPTLHLLPSVVFGQAKGGVSYHIEPMTALSALQKGSLLPEVALVIRAGTHHGVGSLVGSMAILNCLTQGLLKLLAST